MVKYRGGQTVKKGYYLNRTTWEYITITQTGNELPGDKETSYSRIILPILIILGPLLGLLYAVFIPTGYCLVFIYTLIIIPVRKLKMA